MKMPQEVTERISLRATAIAKELAPKKTGRGSMSLQPKSTLGEVGVEVPDNYRYMLYQDQGIKPFTMDNLAGKVIPIRNPNGSISFRTASGNSIGKRKITSRNELGQIITSKISWRHPGLKGSFFIERAIRQAISEWAMNPGSQELIRMLDQSDVSYLMDILRGSK